MSEDDHPRVTVDDDFLDLRNVHSKSTNRRPTSDHLKNRDSASGTTQGKSSTTKEVIRPNLQKLLTNHNNKVCNFGYKRVSGNGQNQSIDSRFRRKIEKKIISVESNAPKTYIEKTVLKHQTDSSSESTEEESTTLKKENENDLSEKLEQSEIIDRVANLPHITVHNKSNKTPENAKPPPPVSSSSKKITFSPETINTDRNKSIKDVVNDIPLVREEDPDIRVIKTVPPKISTNRVTFQDLNWCNPSHLLPRNFDTLQTFKKCWSIPAVSPMMRRTTWIRQQNALCTRVDRRTYEFDETDSVDSNERLSSYSSLFSRNYMNLLFCLGCLCGLFMISGLLTAFQVRSDYYKPNATTPRVSLLELMFREVLHSIRMIFETAYQILTFPSTRFFKPQMESTKSWGLF